jgi:hypothetical protein
VALISHNKKYIYILNPRTASTATAVALQAVTRAQFIPKESIADRSGKIVVQKKHSNIPQLLQHNVITREIADSYFKFVTIRNPYDSLVSLWAKKTKDYVGLLNDPGSWVHRIAGYAESMARAAGKGFPEWVADEFTASLAEGRKGTVNWNYIRGVDHMLRYESLQDDILRIADRIGLPEGFALPEVNRTESRGGRDYREFYDEEARRLVSAVFKEEIDALGYEF